MKKKRVETYFWSQTEISDRTNVKLVLDFIIGRYIEKFLRLS